MMKAKNNFKKITYLLLGMLVFAGTGCEKKPTNEEKPKDQSKLTLSFKPMFKGQVLNMNAFGNVNMHNEDISFNSWGIIMSDVSLIKDDNSKVKLGDGYMYVNLASINSSLTFENIPDGSYKGISYNIGVDSITNHSDPSGWGPTHPLNINYTGMHWGWAGGYIFHTMEGKFKTMGSSSETGFSYHTATDALLSYHEYLMDFSLQGTDAKEAIIEANADKFFLNNISFGTLGTNHSGTQQQIDVMKNLIKNMKEVYVLKSVN